MKINNKSPSCNGVVAEKWKHVSKNKKSMEIVMDTFNKNLPGNACSKN